MNQQYPYSSGFGFYYPPQPHIHVLPDPARYGPPGALSLSAHHHPLPHIHTHGPPRGAPYPPQIHHHVDANGWHHIQQPHMQPPQRLPPSPHTPLYPPGLKVPQKLVPTISASPLKTGQDTGKIDAPKMHEFWVGRLAPPPGFQSRPLLLPMKDPAPPLVETKPITHEKKSLELLPPQSLVESLRKNGLSSPTEVKSDEKVSPISPVKNNEKEEEVKKHFILDRYAESFVPRYLYNIQRVTHTLKPLPATPIFPSISYLNSFLIPRLITDTGATPSLLLAPPIPKDEKQATLCIPSYADHWGDVLRWELDAIVQDKEQIVLWKRSMKVAVWKDAEFVFSVPGIRENYPFLEVGDLVHLREVDVPKRSGSNRALEARVSALRKQEGLVYIHSSPLKEHVQAFVSLELDNLKTENGFAVFADGENIPFVFNVSFMTNAHPLCAMKIAVDTVSRVLTSDADGINLARQWLFPEVVDFTSKPCVMLRDGVISETRWKDPGLNAEQRLAVASISMYQSPVPRLISGPPGTGKTRTVVEAVLQIYHTQPEACILVCAPSNPATDTLVLRLQKNLSHQEMLRLNAPNRTFAEVPDILMPYCYIEDNKFSLPPWKDLMKYRIVVTSCLDAGILVRAQCTNATLMALENEIMAPLHPHQHPKHVVQPHWTHLLVDEGAQGSEPEILIPISVVLPDVYGPDIAEKTFTPQLALCGDINQLGPSVTSDLARSGELEVSLLERLFERPLYSNYLQDVRTQLDLGSLRPTPHTTLVKNYRSHPVILMPPSALFYNDTLQPFAIGNGTVHWTGLAQPSLPLKFIGTDADDKSNDDRASWFNPGQIDIVLDAIQEILRNPQLSNPEVRPKDIGVIAPWRQQVWALRKRLRNEGLSAVDVGTVEDYQGRESRVVIISCVRSSERFLEEDYKKGMGLILQRKRMNVAITRAKELLVIVGKGSLLKRDPYWKSFLQFCVRNGLYEGPDLALDLDGNYISRLESKLIHAGKYALDPEYEGLMISGGVAREALRE